VDSLPEDRLWGVTVLGRELVVWKDGEGQWRVFADSCPHREVALREGRKEADGTMACAYHGWRFDSVCALANDTIVNCLCVMVALMHGRLSLPPCIVTVIMRCVWSLRGECQ
jgi:hypothetical protein